MARSNYLQGQIEAHRKIQNKCRKDGDEVGVKREQRAINKLQKELDKLL